MLKVENRESAHLKSRVKDLSVVPNLVAFTGLFAAITPVAKLSTIEGSNLYEPVLIRDTDSLIANFGDPRIDPEKYIDLYSIMQVVANGTSCYVAKVPSGDTGEYVISVVDDPTIDPDEGDTEDITFTAEPGSNNKVWTVQTNNKWVITRVTSNSSEEAVENEGSFVSEPIPVTLTRSPDASEETESEPTATTDEINYTFISTCLPNDDGKFTVTITLDADEGPSSIVAKGYLDPYYGSEAITLTKQAGADDDKVVDGQRVTVYKSDSLDREYVIKSLEVPSGSSVEIEKFTCEWGMSGGKHVATVTVTFKHIESEDQPAAPASLTVARAARSSKSILAHSSMADSVAIQPTLVQAKPLSLHAYYLEVEVKNGENVLGKAKVKLENTTTNQALVNNLNSALGTYVRFELADADTAGACVVQENGANSIVADLLEICGNKLVPNPKHLDKAIELSAPNFKVTINDYVDALNLYKAKKYTGCIMADLVAPVTDDENGQIDGGKAVAPSSDDRRTLHYYMKEIACERKDVNVILSTPYCLSTKNTTPFTIDDACDWVASRGNFSDLWEYGATNTTDYATQSFYLEMYYSWLSMQCTKIESGKAKSVRVKVAPSNLVINNVLTSYRERGVQYPVAGDQYGVLPETCIILQNPKTKAERDQLIQYRINPIYDTGTRGIQIFGNDTLNAGYTDLNAAHIARTLVYIRSTIDEYTEKLKFSINSMILWDTWKNYVSQYILEPLKSSNALSEYLVEMGTDTTSAAEIANRMIKGNISLIFYQSAEIFDLSYIVYSSATTIEEARANV